MIRHGWTDRAYLKRLTKTGQNLLILDTISFAKKIPGPSPRIPTFLKSNPPHYPLGYAPARVCLCSVNVQENSSLVILTPCCKWATFSKLTLALIVLLCAAFLHAGLHAHHKSTRKVVFREKLRTVLTVRFSERRGVPIELLRRLTPWFKSLLCDAESTLSA